jgi:large subunit ribosomal protein L30
MAKKAKKLQVTLIKSTIGYSKRHKDTVKALGLRRMNSTVVKEDTPVIRGMLALVDHLVSVEEV